MATESAEEVGTGTSGLISGDRIAVDAEEDEGEDAEADEVARNPSDGGFGGGGGGGGPPVDDCCPICFGEFAVACKANCGHWYCGGCILQFWNYSAASRPCKCPMCSASITNLDPEASLLNRQEKEVTEVLREVQRYNRLYVGGARGLVQKVRESPLFIKRIVIRMMDPDRPEYFLQEARLLAMIMSALYAFSPFDFIPINGAGVVRLFDHLAIIIVLGLRLIGLYRQRRLNQRVRQMAAADQHLAE
ncbi:E3 ubiquitin-protein ligase RNF170 [Linum perenne]